MRLNKINDLVRGGRYQRALVEYISYVFFDIPIKSIWDFNIPSIKSRLEKKLRLEASDAFKKNSLARTLDRNANIVIDLNINLIGNSKDAVSTRKTWWRIDFVGTLQEQHGAGKVRLPISEDGSSVITIPFISNQLASGTFCTNFSEAQLEDYSAAIGFDGGGISYSLCQLNSRQATAQLLRDFKLKDLDHSWEKLNLVMLRAGLLDDLCGGNIDPYVNEGLGLGFATQSDGGSLVDHALIYKKFVAELLVSEDPSLRSRAKILDETSPIIEVDAKWKLGEKINYHIEGVKYFCGLMIIHGWIADPISQMKSVILYLHEGGMEYDINPSILRFQRPDLITAFANEGATNQSHFGFVAIQELSPQKIGQKVIVGFQVEEGKIFNEEFLISNVNADLTGLSFIRGIIPDSDITAERCNKFYKPLFNALIQSQPSAKLLVDKLASAALANSREILKPKLSVIIPLYGETRFESTQIPQLAALHRSDWEIIFAIDDPSITNVVIENIERLADNYGLPIRILGADRNLGFSGINNLAASQARADTLLFLNSDCFITTSRPIIDAFEWLNNSNHGAVGFRLFYSDNSVQHDGMSSSLWNDDPDFYLNQHPRSGVASKDLPYKIEHDPARLLTAACFMMKKDLFDQVGGFDTVYFRGDFEDSDLCLKIIAKGKKLGIVRQPGIYHLERQSIGNQSNDLRQIITLVNSNIYSQRWKKILRSPLPALELVS